MGLQKCSNIKLLSRSAQKSFCYAATDSSSLLLCNEWEKRVQNSFVTSFLRAAAFFGFGLHILHTYRFSFEIADMCWCAISEAHMQDGKISFESFFFFFLSSFMLTAQSCSMFSEEFPASHIHFLFSSHNISPLSPPKPTTNGKNGKIQSFSFRRSLLLSVKNKYFILANWIVSTFHSEFSL